MNGESLKSITAGEDMPDRSTVYRWLLAHEGFRDIYTRAREDQADTLADEIIDIADDSANDLMVGENGDEVVNRENVNRARLRVDARKWVAAKLKPRKYGDSTKITGDAEQPIALRITWGASQK